jgi:hypothetical protein
MKQKLSLCAFYLVATAGLASTLSPIAQETAIVDRIFRATKSFGQEAEAFGLLVLVTEGRSDEADSTTAGMIGLKLSDLKAPGLKMPAIRAYAASRIGDVNLPLALDYLSKQTRSDFASAESEPIWSALHTALYRARLNRIVDPGAQILFLESAAKDGGFITRWATTELCDRGSQPSLLTIEDALRKLNPGSRAESELSACLAKIKILSRDPNPVRALASVLHTDSKFDDRGLELWAVRQLVKMSSPEADQALNRYRASINGLPDRSSEKQRLSVVDAQIDALLADRARAGQ